MEKEMKEAAARLDFEVAAVLRDKINLLRIFRIKVIFKSVVEFFVHMVYLRCLLWEYIKMRILIKFEH